MRKPVKTFSRPSQDVPADLVNDILGAIRSQFYSDAPAKQFYQDRQFLTARFVLWPAAWLDKRGVTLPTARYKAILLDVLNTIKRHGTTGAVKYWPGYLTHCLQEHFRHHGEDYYEEGKAIRTTVERSMLAVAGSRDKAPDPIRAMAQAQAILATGRRRAKAAPSSASQLSLFSPCKPHA